MQTPALAAQLRVERSVQLFKNHVLHDVNLGMPRRLIGWLICRSSVQGGRVTVD